MLTNAAVKAARPQTRAYKISDGQGLFLHIAPTGSKSWRMRYRDAGGREQTLTFGLHPVVQLADARARRDRARELLGRGEDPRPNMHSGDANMHFERAARAWLDHRAAGWSPVHAGDVESSLVRDVFPAIGAELLDDIDRPRVLQLLAGVEARGAIETARRIRQRIEAVFAYARAKGWTAVDNPAEVGEALASAPAGGRQAALVDIAELHALMLAVAATPAAPVLHLASRMLALTTVRAAALRGLRWGEIEDIDGDAPIWRVPAARMKLGVGRKLDAAHDHLVPLSPAAVAVLREAREGAGGRAGPADLVFPGRRSGDAPIGAGGLGELYVRAGYAGRHVPHGWRASFSTVMNERRPDDRGAIDRTLGHAPKDMTKVERAYNRAQHLAIRRQLLEEWGSLLAG
jgi:integrase